MKTPFIVCSLFVLLFFFSIETSFACQCVEDKNSSHNQKVREAYRNSAAILAGRVVGIDKTSHQLVNFVTIQVYDVWKTDREVPPIFTIITNKTAEACEFPFVLEADYLIYTIPEANMLATNICLRTAFLNNNPDVPLLNKITRRTPEFRGIMSFYNSTSPFGLIL